MEIVSHCPLLVATRPYRTVRGARFVLIVCKGTFQLTPTTATFGTAPEPIHEYDQRWDDKPDRSVFAPSDIVPFKRDADVLLVGHAFAPGGQPARSIMTRLCIGDIDKSIEVFGDRLFTPHGELRDGPKIVRARLRYERAVGGPSTTNPVGMRHDKKDLFGSVAMASLQPPGLHVTRPEDLLEPVGYGPIAPEWPQRTSRLGHWATTFSPTHWYDDALPDDIDPSFFNVAPPDQRLREVRPDERIVLEGLMADQPRFVTQLPTITPQAVIERGAGRRDPLRLRADTLWIDTNRRLCTVTWRASLALTHPADTGRVVVTLAAPETSRVFARLDPALLAMPITSTGPDSAGTISINLHGKSRAVTPFDPQTITAPETLDLPDDPAFMDDEVTFVQDDNVKSSTLPFVASAHGPNERTTNTPHAPTFDKALPFAASVRAPSASSPGLPFVQAQTPIPPVPVTPPPPPARDLPFFSTSGSSSPYESQVFPTPPAVARPPIAPPPPSPVAFGPPPPPPPRDLPFGARPGSSRPSEPAVFPPLPPLPPLPPQRISTPPPVFPGPPPAPVVATVATVGAATNLGSVSLRSAPPPVPVTPLETRPDAPPMIGPLATPEMLARPALASAPPPAAGVFKAEEKTVPITPTSTAPLDDESIERCARISASIARRKDDRAKILDAEKLDADRFAALQTHWNGAISAETDRGKTKLLEKFDDAYVGRLEEERGVIEAEEFAKIVVSAERGHPDVTMRELGLPSTALMRVERAFLRRTARDLELAQRVLRAIDAERDA